MPGWSQVTATGSATTWSRQTAGGSSTTWPGHHSVISVTSFGWVPFTPVADLWIGVDFIPQASADAPYKSLATSNTQRGPIIVWNPSVVTASDFSSEGQP
jgi:hypothetical protein